jgi:molybdopterin converting factor subunit 1
MRIFMGSFWVFAARLGKCPGLLAARCPSGYNFRMPSVSPSIRVKVLFFGRLRELTGLGEETGELPEGATLAQVFERYEERYPKLAGFRNSMVVSRNQEFAAWDTRVAAGDEIAFLPPVSGG